MKVYTLRRLTQEVDDRCRYSIRSFRFCARSFERITGLSLGAGETMRVALVRVRKGGFVLKLCPNGFEDVHAGVDNMDAPRWLIRLVRKRGPMRFTLRPV